VSDGAIVSTELHHIELGPFARFSGLSAAVGRTRGRSLKLGLVGLPVLLAVGLVAVLMWSAYDSDDAEGEPVQSSTAAIEATAPPATAPAPGSSEEKPVTALTDSPSATAPAPSPMAESAPVNALSISSQSWRRGGLGSKALVTFTLRNNNDYAVKDIELLCAFARRDGSHLTDRKRIIPETVNMKSRKTFARMLVGFVNVNASRAKCAPIAANRS
jgi:hypothetical protein